jgi:hypothetical protein
MRTLVAGKDEIVDGLRREKYLDLIDDYGWELIRGTARFVDGPAVDVDGRELEEVPESLSSSVGTTSGWSSARCSAASVSTSPSSRRSTAWGAPKFPDRSQYVLRLEGEGRCQRSVRRSSSLPSFGTRR